MGDLIPARRKRASRPKVKTGCTNCKLRRVKCDETRPFCFRCQKSGRTCDGYSDQYVRADPAVSSPKLPSGWWECEECGREVNSQIWGYTCPDCSTVNTNERENAQAQTQASKSQMVIETFNIESRPSGAPQAENIVETQPPCLSRIGSHSQLDVQQEDDNFRWRFCHIVICIGLLTFLGSLTLALWWSLARNDVSGGFTMAAYIVAVGGLPLASIQMRHNQRCNCWKKGKEIGVRDLDNG